MKKYMFALSLLIFGLKAIAQNISGVINDYSKVVGIDYCTNSIEVTDPSAFKIDSNVLLIQMKGALIFSNNDPLYGGVILHNGAGNYEIQKVKSKSGNQIFFTYNIERFYDPLGAVQLVTIPSYKNATVSAPLSCAKWDGTIGGVLILDADTLSLSDSISVSGKGFRGGALFNETTCFNNGTGGATTYRCAAGGDCGATKGEGISNMPFLLGRGPNANGGGGGNDHNTGGGGGGGFAAGGKGGQRSNVSNISCPGQSPGEGGKAQSYDPTQNRIFMGGGGGAGDQNNSEGTPGNDGGGVVFISAKTIIGNAQRICSNGSSVSTLARADGAGAGGGAGIVMINANSIVGNLNVELIGGKGGNLDNGGSLTFCFGPGGGGAGGGLLVNSSSLFPAINLSAKGGLSGIQSRSPGPAVCPFGTINGAEAGQDGGSLAGYTLYKSTTPFVPLSLTFKSNDTSVCSGSPLVLNVEANASHPYTYSWGNGQNGNAINVSPTFTQNYSVLIKDSNNCQLTTAINVSIPNVQIALTVVPDTAIDQGQTVQFNTPFIGGYQYDWSPSSTLNSSTIFNPVASPLKTTTYCLTVTNAIQCKDSVCVVVEVKTPVIIIPEDTLPEIRIPTAFTPNNDGTNDLFKIIVGAQTEIKELNIYNRFGERVFDGTNNNGWDGTYKGKPQPSETYICKVSYQSNRGTKKTLHKMISFELIR